MTAPSKWKLYWSESKGTYMRIEDMPGPHIANAIKKLERLSDRNEQENETLDSLKGELAERDAQRDPEGT